MEKILFQRWCLKWWLYAVYAIGILMCIYLVIRWGQITPEQRLMGLLAVFVPIHVFEENSYPGGFFYMMNVMRRSPMPLRYPMNTVQDMFTNLVATILFAVITVVNTTIGMVIVVCFFGIAESVAHTLMGTIMYRKYKGNGKRTIYGPGVISAYVTMLPLSIYAILWIAKQEITCADWVVGIGTILFIIFGLILIPQIISTIIKSPNYEFEDAEYFQKFL